MQIQDLWNDFNFTPNTGQEEAALHTDGPLLITAGPGSGSGSGKTRVLRWRTVNLIVFYKVPP
ncbi:MAG: UvrD-helicase domain-containing protein [Bacteroidota bacterium]